MRYQFILMIIFAIILFNSCGKNEVEIEYFKIKVDSVYLQDTILSGDTLNIHLYGVIGSNGCYSFHRYESDININTLILTIWGKLEKHEICTLLLPLLDDEFRVYPPGQGYFFININQPDGSIFRDSVFVR